jgi:LuxR family transcriptional regulator, maltose regulon positive regulatory protein
MTSQAPSLTPREREVLQLLCRGTVSNADLAAALMVSTYTVEWHVKQIMAKTETNTRGELIARAWTDGLVEGAA